MFREATGRGRARERRSVHVFYRDCCCRPMYHYLLRLKYTLSTTGCGQGFDDGSPHRGRSRRVCTRTAGTKFIHMTNRRTTGTFGAFVEWLSWNYRT